MKHLILDLETDSLDTNLANIKIFGGYDVEEGKFFIIKWAENKDKIRELVKKYDWIITFNGQDYDLPILERHQISIPHYKHIDLYQVCKRRTTIIKADGFDSFKLRNIVKELKLDDEGGKGEIDYKIFMKDDWSIEEKEQIVKYTKQDLLITYKLWHYMTERFKDFTQFIPEKDVLKYKHITSSSGGFAYKAICKITGLQELYGSNTDHEVFKGAFVSSPSQESAKGLIVCLDFASLYPFCMLQGNLYSDKCECCSKEERWHGGDFFKVSGYYCSKTQGLVEQTIKQLYLKRKEYKKTKDSREYVLKIILNSLYGISGNESFISLYSQTAAPDCTALGRRCINYARGVLSGEGFTVLYSDTDSAYVLVPPNKTLDNLMDVSRAITEFLSSQFPFGWKEEFTFKIDEIIKYIHFFKDDEEGYKKKMYLYVNKDNKLVIKGLKVIKLDCSELSTRIFEEILKPLIIKELDCKFNKKFIEEHIRRLLKEDLSLGLKRFNIKDKYDSESSIQEQIRRVYGSGEIKLIKNKVLGVGKAGKYCTLEEAKTLRFEDLDFEVYLKELEPFLKDVVVKSGGLTGYFIGNDIHS